jgi:hypothetical protein
MGSHRTFSDFATKFASASFLVVVALFGAACSSDDASSRSSVGGDASASPASDATPVSLTDEVTLVQGPAANGGQLFRVGSHTVAVQESSWRFDGAPRITDTAAVKVRVGNKSQEVVLRRTLVYGDDGPVRGFYTYEVAAATS